MTVQLRIAALMAIVFLVGCASGLPEEAKPKTPIQHYIAAVHDYTLQANAVEVFIDANSALALAGDASAFEAMPMAEELAGLVEQGAVTIRKVQTEVKECTGMTPEQVDASPVRLESCPGLTVSVIVATGDLRGLISNLKPRLAAVGGGS